MCSSARALRATTTTFRCSEVSSRCARDKILEVHVRRANARRIGREASSSRLRRRPQGATVRPVKFRASPRRGELAPAKDRHGCKGWNVGGARRRPRSSPRRVSGRVALEQQACIFSPAPSQDRCRPARVASPWPCAVPLSLSPSLPACLSPGRISTLRCAPAAKFNFGYRGLRALCRRRARTAHPSTSCRSLFEVQTGRIVCTKANARCSVSASRVVSGDSRRRRRRRRTSFVRVRSVSR